MSSNKCARCDQTVYPVEGLRCLDKLWHKGCFKCQECGMTLNLKNHKGFDKLPYCNAHCPQAKATTVADTPESRRLAENTRIQSQAKYHEDFEKSKGKGFTTIADDPETLRIKNTSKIISNVAYHGELERKKQMEEKRTIQIGPEHDQSPLHNNNNINIINNNDIHLDKTNSQIMRNSIQLQQLQLQQQSIHLNQKHNQVPNQAIKNNHHNMNNNLDFSSDRSQKQHHVQQLQQQAFKQSQQIHYAQDHNGQQMINRHSVDGSMSHQHHHQQQNQLSAAAKNNNNNKQASSQPTQQLPHHYPTTPQRHQQQMILLQQQQQQQQKQRHSMDPQTIAKQSLIMNNNQQQVKPPQMISIQQLQQQQHHQIMNPNNPNNSIAHHPHQISPIITGHNVGNAHPQMLNAVRGGPGPMNRISSTGLMGSHAPVLQPSAHSASQLMPVHPQAVGPTSYAIGHPIQNHNPNKQQQHQQQQQQQQQQHQLAGPQFINQGPQQRGLNHPPQQHMMHHGALNQSQRQHQQPLMGPQAMSRRVFRAMYDYVANDVDEVSFYENDILVDCVNIDGNWLIGKVARSGQTGMLPANYVTEVISSQ